MALELRVTVRGPRTQVVRDQGPARLYWTQLPNLIDDSLLDPFARTLYVHYRRIAGAREDSCEETVRQSAERCRMSIGAVVKARAALVEDGWITVETVASRGRGALLRIHLLDKWPENMARYAPAAMGNVHSTNISAPTSECSPGERNDRSTNVPNGNVRVVVVNVHHPDINRDASSLTPEELKEPETKEPDQDARARADAMRDGTGELAGFTDPPLAADLRKPADVAAETHEEASRTWAAAAALLRQETSAMQWETYLAGCQGSFYAAEARLLRVTVSNPFHVLWLERNFGQAVHRAVAAVLGRPTRVEFVAPELPAPVHADRRTR